MKKLALLLTITTCFAASDEFSAQAIAAREKALAEKKEAAKVAEAKAAFTQEHTKTLTDLRSAQKTYQQSYTGEPLYALNQRGNGLIDQKTPQYEDARNPAESLATLRAELTDSPADREAKRAALIEKRTLARRNSVANLADIRRESGDVYRDLEGKPLHGDRTGKAPRLADIKEEGDASKAMAAEVKYLRERNSNLEARLELMTERIAQLRTENSALRAQQTGQASAAAASGAATAGQ